MSLAHSSVICLPFQSAVRPFASSRISSVAASNSRTLTGSSPIVRRAESPRPIITTTRPGAMELSVAWKLAVTVGSRVPGLVTQKPRPMRSVCAAAAARNAEPSCQRMCES